MSIQYQIDITSGHSQWFILKVNRSIVVADDTIDSNDTDSATYIYIPGIL